VPDATDNCTGTPNANQANDDSQPIDLHVYGKLFDDITNASGDRIGDACDIDSDNDGLIDLDEIAGSTCRALTDPMKTDTDVDRVLDGVECALGTSPANAASFPPAMPSGGTDHDGLTDGSEMTIVRIR
jgi:hypothetical protein